MRGSRPAIVDAVHNRYRKEYRDIHRKDRQVAFFEEIGQMAAQAGAPAWEKFADAMCAWLRKDFGTAVALCEDAIALDPEFAHPWNGKGNVLRSLNRYDEALVAYERAIALDPEFAYPWNGKGSVLRSLNRYDEALVAFERAIALDPEDSYPWNGKGNILSDLERYEEALVAYERAIALDPESAHLHHNLGLEYWRQGRPREAMQAFLHELDLELKPEPRQATEAWIERAKRSHALEEAGGSAEEREQEDRSSDEALVADLFEALKSDLPAIREKKMEFTKLIAESVGRSRIVGKGGADDMLLVLRDWNSFSPILRRELRNQNGRGPDERRGGGYFLVWKGHGIVVDPGVDFVTQLYRKGLSIADVDTVTITHCHLDHTRDLESLVDLNYRYNQARGLKPHPPNADFRELQFRLCYPALIRYGEYLKNSGCCRTPAQLERDGAPVRVTEFIDVHAVSAKHSDINGRDDEAIGLVFVLKDESGPVVRVGMTSDSKWIDSLPESFSGCDVVVAHLGTIEVGEGEAPADAGKSVEGGGFLKTDLRNHLGTKGCFRLLQRVKPTIFVLGEFGEELLETRLKILQVFNRLKPHDTRFVLGADSNLSIGLGHSLSLCCSHPECAHSWSRIPLDRVRPVLGGDLLFQYICTQHDMV